VVVAAVVGRRRVRWKFVEKKRRTESPSEPSWMFCVAVMIASSRD